MAAPAAQCFNAFESKGTDMERRALLRCAPAATLAAGRSAGRAHEQLTPLELAIKVKIGWAPGTNASRSLPPRADEVIE
jgi:hypothetical protein